MAIHLSSTILNFTHNTFETVLPSQSIQQLCVCIRCVHVKLGVAFLTRSVCAFFFFFAWVMSTVCM